MNGNTLFMEYLKCGKKVIGDINRLCEFCAYWRDKAWIDDEEYIDDQDSNQCVT